MQTDIGSLLRDFHLAGNRAYHPLENRVIIVALIYIYGTDCFTLELLLPINLIEKTYHRSWHQQAGCEIVGMVLEPFFRVSDNMVVTILKLFAYRMVKDLVAYFMCHRETVARIVVFLTVAQRHLLMVKVYLTKVPARLAPIHGQPHTFGKRIRVNYAVRHFIIGATLAEQQYEFINLRLH